MKQEVLTNDVLLDAKPFKKKKEKKTGRWQSFKRRFLKPFWFSKNCDNIKVPYMYGNVVMILFIASNISFLCMALAGTYTAGTLAAVGGVIATLAGMFFGVMKIYLQGTSIKNENNYMKAEIKAKFSGVVKDD